MVAGLRDIGTTAAKRVVPDVKDEIVLVQPSSAPVTFFLKKFKKREVSQYSYDHLEKDMYPRMAKVSGAQTSDDVTIELIAGHGVRVPKNAVMLNRRTREMFLVTAISTDALTSVRGIGGVAEAMLDGDDVEFQFTAFEDGTTSGDMKSVKEDPVTNYTQIIRTKYGFTGRQVNTKLFGGNDKKTEGAWQAIDHTVQIEQMLLFGRKHTRTGAGGKFQTFSGGAEYHIKTNVWDVNGNIPTVDDIVQVLEEFMKHGRGGYLGGTKKKIGFFSPRWMSIFSKLAHSQLQYRPPDTSLGIEIAEIATPHGKLMLVEDPLLTGPEHGGWGFIIDLNHAYYTYHQGRNTRLLDNRQANDADSEELEWFSDCGAEFEIEFAHGIWKGLPGF
jgi:hypothetical protein